jgi:Ring finger domain
MDHNPVVNVIEQLYEFDSCAGIVAVGFYSITSLCSLSLAAAGFGCLTRDALTPLDVKKMVLGSLELMWTGIFLYFGLYTQLILLQEYPKQWGLIMAGAFMGLSAILVGNGSVRAFHQLIEEGLADVGQRMRAGVRAFRHGSFEEEVVVFQFRGKTLQLEVFKWKGVWSAKASNTSHADGRVQETAVPHDGGNTCTICLEDFRRGNVIAVLPCGHLFHRRCIEGWLEKSLTCVNCRMEFEWKLASKTSCTAAVRR